MVRRRLIINFKNTPEDIELYEALKKHSSVTAYVKDVLKGVTSQQPTPMKQRTTIVNKNGDTNEILDILG